MNLEKVQTIQIVFQFSLKFIEKNPQLPLSRMSKFGNYELSAEKRQLETVKYQRRMDLRSEFLKQQSNPHVHAEKGGGVLVCIKVYCLSFKYPQIGFSNHW